MTNVKYATKSDPGHYMVSESMPGRDAAKYTAFVQFQMAESVRLYKLVKKDWKKSTYGYKGYECTCPRCSCCGRRLEQPRKAEEELEDEDFY